jgi:two-component system cell cycle response regulator DivK
VGVSIGWVAGNGKEPMGPADIVRDDAGVAGKADEQRLIGQHVLQHAGEEAGRRSGLSNRLRADARNGQESAKPFGVAGEIGKGTDGQLFRCLFSERRGPLSLQSDLPFGKESPLVLRLLSSIGQSNRGDAPRAGPAGTGIMPKTVLVVEDNELNMKLFHDLLEANGYNIVQTRNGLEAIDLARAHRPDLILMDIQLPEVSGLEVTKWIKEDDDLKTIPIIAVTAFAMKGDEERIRQGGCEAYLSKPISVSKFIETVKAYLGDG